MLINSPQIIESLSQGRVAADCDLVKEYDAIAICDEFITHGIRSPKTYSS